MDHKHPVSSIGDGVLLFEYPGETIYFFDRG